MTVNTPSKDDGRGLRERLEDIPRGACRRGGVQMGRYDSPGRGDCKPEEKGEGGRVGSEGFEYRGTALERFGGEAEGR